MRFVLYLFPWYCPRDAQYLDILAISQMNYNYNLNVTQLMCRILKLKESNIEIVTQDFICASHMTDEQNVNLWLWVTQHMQHLHVRSEYRTNMIGCECYTDYLICDMTGNNAEMGAFVCFCIY